MINIRNLYNKCDTTDCILMIFVYRFITISFYLRRCVRSVAYIFRIFYPIYCIPLYCCFYKIVFFFLYHMYKSIFLNFFKIYLVLFSSITCYVNRLHQISSPCPQGYTKTALSNRRSSSIR